MDQTWTRASRSGDVVSIQWDGERLRALAEVYLRAVAIGAPANELARWQTPSLAASWYGWPKQALGATEHRTARATELAGTTLDVPRSDAPADKAERPSAASEKRVLR